MAGAAGLVLPQLVKASNCIIPTPKQTEGPFYPIDDQLDKDADLTVVKGLSGIAKGEVVFVSGTVMNTRCEPIKGALVEIWQACETGRYNHPDDPNTGVALDPNFQYWGRAFTDEKGQYLFKTIKPGHYPATQNWIRPSHIHYKVKKTGFVSLTTQMYFEGDPHNEHDEILMRHTPAEREQLIVKFQNGKGNFNITMKEV